MRTITVLGGDVISGPDWRFEDRGDHIVFTHTLGAKTIIYKNKIVTDKKQAVDGCGLLILLLLVVGAVATFVYVP